MHPASPVMRFHGQAMIRAARFMPGAHRLDLTGLQITEGYLPGGQRFPHWDESSVVVSSTAPSDDTAVQIILTPRIQGPALSDEDLTPAKIVAIKAAREEALQHGRFVEVKLGLRSQIIPITSRPAADAPAPADQSEGN